MPANFKVSYTEFVGIPDHVSTIKFTLKLDIVNGMEAGSQAKFTCTERLNIPFLLSKLAPYAQFKNRFNR